MVNTEHSVATLADILQDFLYEHRYDHDLFNDLQKNLKKHEIFSKDILDILNKNIEFKDLPTQELVLYAQIVYRNFSDVESFNPRRYFKPAEIKNSLYYSRETKDEYIKLPLTIHNVLRVQYDEYLSVVPIKTLVSMLNSSIITYNFESQRNAKTMADSNGRIVRAININQKSVEEIAQLIIKKEYLPDMITFNMLLGSNEEQEEFVIKGSSIVINEGTQLDILDGFHRLSAMQVALEVAPDLDLCFPVAFKNFDLQKAKRYVGQTNTFNVMPKAYVEHLRSQDHYSYVVNELINKSDLRGRVSLHGNANYEAGELTTITRLKEAIQKHYKIRTKREAQGIIDELTELFDELVFLYLKEEYKARETLFFKKDGIDIIMKKYKKNKNLQSIDRDFLLA